MRRIEKVFGFYVFSNIHVSLSASSLVLLTLVPYEPENLSCVLFVFCGTILAYNFIRAVQMDQIYPSLSHWIRSSVRPLAVLNVLALFGLIWSVFHFSVSDLVFVSPFFLLTLFYVIPFQGSFRGFRSLPGFKLFLIAAVWAGVTVLFPLRVNDHTLDVKAWVVFAQRFLFVLAITIPFDIRDLQLDRSDLSTLPQFMGVDRSKHLALGALFVFAVLFFFKDFFTLDEQLIGVAVALLSAGFVLKAGVYQGRFYSSFWVEAIPIVWWVLSATFT